MQGCCTATHRGQGLHVGQSTKAHGTHPYSLRTLPPTSQTATISKLDYSGQPSGRIFESTWLNVTFLDQVFDSLNPLDKRVLPSLLWKFGKTTQTPINKDIASTLRMGCDYIFTIVFIYFKLVILVLKSISRNIPQFKVAFCTPSKLFSRAFIQGTKLC